MLKESDIEIRRAKERLKVVQQNILHFRFLRTVLQTRFPDTRIWVAAADRERAALGDPRRRR